jgi:hypothetical protein
MNQASLQADLDDANRRALDAEARQTVDDRSKERVRCCSFASQHLARDSLYRSLFLRKIWR